MNSTPCKILIVEDDPGIRMFLKTTLSTNGCEPLVAATGREALEMITSHCPDCVLLDLGLPDMDGTEIIKNVHAWSKIPIVVISARGSEEDKARALDLGADDYLVKPFGAIELMARIRTAIRHTVTVVDNEHGVHAHGRAVFVNNAHLRLAVRLYEVRAALAVRRQPAGKRMGQIYGQGHIFFRFVGGIAEHHALIPRAGGHILRAAFLRLKRFIHAHGNIARLLIQRYQHRAAVARKAGGIIRIAYFVHGGAHKGRYVHLRLRRYFAHHQHQACRCRAFARHAGIRILSKVRIEHAVA